MYIRTSHQERLELGIGEYSCNWGVHIAGLYETRDELDEILFGFLCAGVDAGDLQLYAPAERSIDAFQFDFGRACPGHAHALDDEHLFSTVPARDLYYPEGVFSPWDMDRGLSDFYRNSQAGGRRNVRATADMVWALEAIPGTEHLMAYEARLNYFIPGKPWISICLYNLTRFSGDVIMGVLRTHPWVLNKGVLTANPYFIDPAAFLRANAPEFLPSS